MQDLDEFTWHLSSAPWKWVDARPVPPTRYELLADGWGDGVVAAGYRGEWEVPDGAGDLGRYLTTGDAGMLGTEVSTYDVEEEQPALFRKFAELPPEEASFADFARAHGPLGLFHQICDGSGLSFGEPLRVWQEQVSLMRQCVATIDALKAKDVQAVVRAIAPDREAWERVRADAFMRPIERNADGFYYLAPALDERPAFATGPEHLAKSVLRRLVNEQLAKHCAPRLIYVRRAQSAHLFIVPHHLLGAMWLQLAREVDGSSEFERCALPDCQEKRWFRKDKARKGARFCTETCRKRAYRQRQDQARGGGR